MRQMVFLFMGVVMLAAPAWSGDGGQPGNFMNLATDARTLAMGRAGVADAQASIFWNPAAMAFSSKQAHHNTTSRFMLMHTAPFPDTNYNFMEYSQSFGRSALGLSMVREETGGIICRGYDNTPGETIGFVSMAALLSASSLFTDTFSAGVALKSIRNGFTNSDYSGNGLDIGCLFKPTDELSLGVSLQNLVQPTMEGEKIPMNLKVGFGARFLERLLLELDIDKNSNQGARVHAGSEFTLGDKLGLRAGYDQGLGVTAGLGIKMGVLCLDYAWLNHDYEPMHRFSLTANIGQEKAQLPPKQEVKKPLPVEPLPEADISGEKLLFASEKKRPEWIERESQKRGEFYLFVGVSGNQITEQAAKDDALKSAMKRIAQNLGVSVEFEGLLSEGILTQVKPKQWYVEKWQDREEEIYWKAMVLVEVPNKSLNEAYKTISVKQKEMDKEKEDKAKEEKAKRQVDEASKVLK